MDFKEMGWWRWIPFCCGLWYHETVCLFVRAQMIHRLFLGKHVRILCVMRKWKKKSLLYLRFTELLGL